LTLPRDADLTPPTGTTRTASEMTDRDDDLKATIEHLRELLDGVDNIDPQARQLLTGALGDIHDKLGTDTQDQPDSEQQESVIERLTEAAKHFDDEHPTMAGMIGSVIDTLGRMGI
jgi:hypothetical protein